MNTETINAIKEALAPIAEKIGQGAEYGWTIVVKQQYVQGITDFIWAGLDLGFTGLMIFSLVKSIQKIKEDSDYFPWVAVSIGGVFLTSLITFGLLTDGVMHVINPDYYALDFFIHLGSNQ